MLAAAAAAAAACCWLLLLLLLAAAAAACCCSKQDTRHKTQDTRHEAQSALLVWEGRRLQSRLRGVELLLQPGEPVGPHLDANKRQAPRVVCGQAASACAPLGRQGPVHTVTGRGATATTRSLLPAATAGRQRQVLMCALLSTRCFLFLWTPNLDHKCD